MNLQKYDLVNNEITPMWLCGGCGAVVADKTQHDVYHNKTRSIV